MAKLQGLVGSGRGKVGNMVLSKGENGETIARAYQPVVANPRTAAQTSQRSRVNIAGRLSALVPAGAIGGLNMGSNRKNRSEFLKTLIKAAVNDTTPAGAHIPAADVIFSRGAVPFSATLGTVAVSRTAVSVPFTDANIDGQHGERVVVVVVNPEGVQGGYEMCRYTSIIYAQATGTVEVALDVPLVEGQQVFVYRIPMQASAKANRTNYGPLQGTTDSYITVDDTIVTASMEMGTSILAANTVAPANRTSKKKEE